MKRLFLDYKVSIVKKAFLTSAIAFATSIAVGSSAMAEIFVVRSEKQSNSKPVVQPVTYTTSNQGNSEVRAAINKSVKEGDFQAPSYATTVSSQNKKTFNTQIPSYASNFRLKNPPYYMQCFYASSQKYGVPVDILLAIAQTESSFNHQITGRLGYGADHGLMQINDYWVPKLRKRFNITLSDLYEPCTNIEIASWILAHNFVQFGYSWRAIGAYNAVTESKRVKYINKVSANLQKLYAGQL